MCHSIAYYEVQTWVLTKTLVTKLIATVNRVLRSIVNIKLKYKVKIIKNKTKAKDVGCIAKKLKFKFVGHLARAMR